MKKNIIYTLLAVVAVTSFIACKKGEDGIVGTWKVTGATFTPPVTFGGTTYTDAYPLLFDEACTQDNLFIFKEGNQVIEDEGATKCDTADVQQSSANYTLNGSVLTIINSSDTTVFTNVSVDEDNLKGTLFSDFGGGTTANVVITWTRQ